jgi:hypothetical protein
MKRAHTILLLWSISMLACSSSPPKTLKLRYFKQIRLDQNQKSEICKKIKPEIECKFLNKKFKSNGGEEKTLATVLHECIFKEKENSCYFLKFKKYKQLDHLKNSHLVFHVRKPSKHGEFFRKYFILKDETRYNQKGACSAQKCKVIDFILKNIKITFQDKLILLPDSVESFELKEYKGWKQTQKPKTQKPKTQKPKTQKPETQKPKTQKPKTQKLKTQKPKTQKPKPLINFNWLVVYDNSDGSTLVGKNSVADALQSSKLNIKFGAVVNALHLDSVLNKDSLVEEIYKKSPQDRTVNIVQSNRAIQKKKASLIKRKINALLYIGYDTFNTSKDNLEALNPLKGLLKIIYLIIDPNDNKCSKSKIKNQKDRPKYYRCVSIDEIEKVINKLPHEMVGP